nr:hypothetical protein [Afipia sp.]
MLPPEIVAQFAKRGRPKALAPKTPISIRLNPKVIQHS